MRFVKDVAVDDEANLDRQLRQKRARADEMPNSSNQQRDKFVTEGRAYVFWVVPTRREWRTKDLSFNSGDPALPCLDGLQGLLMGDRGREVFAGSAVAGAHLFGLCHGFGDLANVSVAKQDNSCMIWPTFWRNAQAS